MQYPANSDSLTRLSSTGSPFDSAARFSEAASDIQPCQTLDLCVSDIAIGCDNFARIRIRRSNSLLALHTGDFVALQRKCNATMQRISANLPHSIGARPKRPALAGPGQYSRCQRSTGRRLLPWLNILTAVSDTPAGRDDHAKSSDRFWHVLALFPYPSSSKNTTKTSEK